MEPKTSVKSVAADEITVNVPVKIIGGGGGEGGSPGPSPLRHCFGVVHKEIYNINIAKRRHSVFVQGLVYIIYIGLCILQKYAIFFLFINNILNITFTIPTLNKERQKL